MERPAIVEIEENQLRSLVETACRLPLRAGHSTFEMIDGLLHSSNECHSKKQALNEMHTRQRHPNSC
jgi:hypothetical protein